MIDKNSSWDWNYGEATNKPLMAYGIDEETNEVKVEDVTEIPNIVDIKVKI